MADTTPPSTPVVVPIASEGRAWFYAIGWLGAGVAAGGLTVWLITLIRWDWPSNLAERQLTILGNALYGSIGLMMLVILGLTIRNAIRNIKGSVGVVNFEASGDGKNV